MKEFSFDRYRFQISNGYAWIAPIKEHVGEI